MDRQSEIEFWERAARQRDALGEHATAISFRNMAYMLAQPHDVRVTCGQVLLDLANEMERVQ